MVDSSLAAPNLRDGAVQSRPLSLSVSALRSGSPKNRMPPDHRVAAIQKAIDNLISKGLPDNSRLQISQDKETGTYIYSTVNRDTGKVMRQWPSENVIELGKQLGQTRALLVDKQV